MKSPKCYALNKFSEENNRGLKVLNAKTIYLQDHHSKDLIALGKFLADCGEQLSRKSNKSFHLHFRDSKYCGALKNKKLIIDVIVGRTK